LLIQPSSCFPTGENPRSFQGYDIAGSRTDGSPTPYTRAAHKSAEEENFNGRCKEAYIKLLITLITIGYKSSSVRLVIVQSLYTRIVDDLNENY